MSHPKLRDLLLDTQAGFASGERLESDGVIQVRMNNVETDGSWNWTNERRVPVSQKQLERCRLQFGDVLFNCTNSPELVGKSALFTERSEDVVFSNHFFRLRVDPERLEPAFLSRWLQLKWWQGDFKAMCNSWVNQASVRKEDLLALSIPLPSLEAQRHIVQVLDLVQKLNQQARQMESELNRLALSLFLEMFGDPMTNPKGWQTKSIKEVSSVTTGGTPSRAKPEYYGNHIEWIKSDNINTPAHFLTVANEFLSEAGEKVGRTVGRGAVLLTCIAGSPECIGNAAITDRKVAFNQQINAVMPTDGVLATEYFYMLCLAGKKLIQNASTNSMKGMVSKGNLEKIQIPVPPFEKQELFQQRFLSIFEIGSLGSSQKYSLTELFNSLIQRAFKGELIPKTA